MKKFTVTATGTFTRTATVEANSEEEALDLFETIDEGEIDEELKTEEVLVSAD